MKLMSLCVLLVAVPLQNAQSPTPPPCYNTWITEPDPEPLQCNILDETVTVQMSCGITIATQNQSIAWMFSKSRDEAGTANGEVLSEVAFMLAGNSGDSRIATLTLSPGTIQHGYYWCKAVNATSGLYQNPSTIVNINDTCITTACSSSVITVKQKNSPQTCANGDAYMPPRFGNLLDTGDCMSVGQPTTSTSTKGDTTTTEKIDATLPPITTPDVDKSGSVSSDSDSKEPSTSDPPGPTSGNTPATQGGTGGMASLSTGIIWLIVGVTIALLLVVIAVLLSVITCLQCSRRKVKDRASSMPHHFDNRAYQETELNNSFIQSLEAKNQQEALNGNHTYAVIPENFTLQALSGEHSPGSQTNQQRPPASVQRSLPGQYEDIDLDPAPSKAPAESSSSPHTRRHQYESVSNDDDEVSYHRLQRTGSKSRKLSSTASLSGTSPSVGLPPSLLSRGEMATPTARDGTIFDNPKYSQLNKPKHVDIYRSASSESGSGGTGNTSPEQSGTPRSKQLARAKLSNPLGTNRGPGDRDDEYFQDSSVFIVNGLAQGETRGQPVDHYTALKMPAPESNYTVAIVSTSDKYVSEQGHLYQVLEDAKMEKEEVETTAAEAGEREQREKTVTQLPPTYSTVVRKDAHKSVETTLTIANSDTLESSSSHATPTSAVVYHTLVHSSEPSGKEDTPTTTTPYNVIDWSTKPSKASSQSSLNNDVAYNVIDRKTSTSQMPLLQYDVIERSGRTSQLSNTSPKLQATRVGYSVIAPPSAGSTNHAHSSPGSIRTTTNTVGGSASKGSPSPPPPSYSSLEMGGAKQRVCQCDSNTPFYHSLEQRELDTALEEKSEGLYASLETSEEGEAGTQ